MSTGTQPNGLPSSCISYDTITTHDWAHSDEWVVSSSDSAWELVPDSGEAIKVTGVLIKFSEDLIIHSDGNHIVEGIIDGFAGSPCKLSEYVNMRAFMGRADIWSKLDYNGPSNGDTNGPIICLKFDFSRPPCLWSSGGVAEGQPLVDNLGIPRWQKMRCRIANNVPYKDNDGNPAQIACSRYFIERYEDPFV